MYELTIYFVLDKTCYDVVHKTFDFNDTNEMIRFCADFNTEDFEILFDVWTGEEQININPLVEGYKTRRNNNDNR